MGYTDETVNIFERDFERRIEKELARMMQYKNASDTLARNKMEEEKLYKRKELETIIKSGLNDSSLLPAAKDSLAEYSRSNPRDANYSKQISFELDTAETLNNEKTKTRIGVENSLNAISNLDPLVKTSQEDLDSLLGVVNQWQDRASELGMNQILSTSNTRENQLVSKIKKTNAVNQSLDTFLKHNGDLDPYSLVASDLQNVKFYLESGDVPNAVQSLQHARTKKSAGGKRLAIGKDEDGSTLMGTIVGPNEAFKKEKNDKGIWAYSLDEQGERIFNDNVRLDVAGHEGRPIIEDSKKIKKGLDPWDPSALSEEHLVAGGYKKVDNVWQDPDGNPADQMEMAKYAQGMKTKRMMDIENKKITEERNIKSGIAIEQMVEQQQSMFTVSPLNEKNITGRSKGNSKRYKDAHTVGMLYEKDWFHPKSMSAPKAIEVMQDDILVYMAETMENFKPSENLKGTFDSEDNRVKGALAVFNSKEFKGIMTDTSKEKDLINQNFNFLGIEGNYGQKWDDDSIAQAEILQRYYHIWAEMERQKLFLKGENLGGGGYAPGLPH